ncbi:MAG: helix-turn-helix domain-containing protein [Oscillospiraceae bacterium]|nr:helix-turn-helix domain-containing protein [Oscillospiraceae bacterium]
MEYITAKEASEIWAISKRRVQALLETGRIPGANKLGSQWAIPKGTPKPMDGRTKIAKQIAETKE